MPGESLERFSAQVMTLESKDLSVSDRKLHDDVSVERFLKGYCDKVIVYEIQH